MDDDNSFVRVFDSIECKHINEQIAEYMKRENVEPLNSSVSVAGWSIDGGRSKRSIAVSVVFRRKKA